MIAVVDFETGGLDLSRHAIVSVACLLIDENLQEYGRWYTLINDPGWIIEDKALEINGIDRSALSNGMPVNLALMRLKEMVAANVFAAHNAAFDARIYNLRAGANVTKAIDTMRIAYDVWPYPAKARLGILCERLRIPVLDAHNALGDVLMVAELIRRFARMKMQPPALEPLPIEWNWKPWL